MSNIKTTKGKITFNKTDYVLQNFTNDSGESVSYALVSDSQVHIGTDKGIILFDLSCTINKETFTDINLFTAALY